jgi:phosphatidate cytidylyltransferase
LVFFTVLFYVWAIFKKSLLLTEMITRTHSWWAIFFLYILFFCVHPSFGQIGIALIGLGAIHELFGKWPEDMLPQDVRILAYVFAIMQFAFASRGSLLPTAVFLPVVFFLVVNVWTVLFEPLKMVMAAPSLAIWGLLLSVYGLSHLSLLLAMPPIAGFQGTTSGLFLYYIFLTQFNDVLQFIWGTLFGHHAIAPHISPKKTWEGFLGGAATTTLLAVLLRNITPFNFVQSALVGIALGVFGYLGDLNISAIKRNLGVKDMGSVIPGHGGILDRIDSITLSSLVYFYLIVFWFY